MTTNNKNPFFAGQSESGEFETLEPGSYNGVCIGVVVREFPNFNDRNVMDDKVQFVFQIVDGAQQYYLRSKPCKLVINDKSNLYLLINSWTKATLERMAEGFACEKMVGFGAQIIVNNREYNGKLYADIANLLPLKRGVKVPVTPAEIPAFLAKGAKAQLWAEGITVKADQAVTKPEQAPTITFQGKQGVEPSKQANITQNADPAGWMGAQGFQVTQVAPEPELPMQTATQAMQQEGIPADGEDDELPF